MGFYGNITNAARTQFQFDRIYPNRKAMEAVQTIDGVYIGRYVLIEYGTDVHSDYYKRVWKINNKFYFSYDAQEQSELTTLNTTSGQIVRVEPDNYPDNDAGTTIFYSIKHSNGICIFTEIQGSDTNYSSNYNIDLAEYYGESGGRGYDSTVWQKVYIEGVEKYVMVAELNTVVPTFDITPDAPTMSPRLPHFDADSTNVYYKLHWQPQWGLRIKGAKAYGTPKLNDDGTNYKNNSGKDVLISSSADTKIYPSDLKTAWTRHEYDRVTGYTPTYKAEVGEDNITWTTGANENDMPAAVYFNNAGFDSKKITYYKDHYSLDSGITPTYNGYNQINIEPTGYSGHTYSVHQPGVQNDCDVDIQELSIMLPGVGDAIAKMWDIVYGGEEVSGSRMRNQDIYWNSVNGVRMVKENPNGEGYSYNSREHISTIAGCINSVHDLMGMIIEKPAATVFEGYLKDSSKAAKATDNMIYYYNGRYYRKKKTYNYSPLVDSDFNFIQDTNAQHNYKDGYYFTGQTLTNRDLNKAYASSTQYYEAQLKNALDFGDPVSGLIDYEANKYWITGPAQSWIKATAPTVNADESYYTLSNFKEIVIQNNYEPDKYYKIDGHGNYKLERSDSVPNVAQYYTISTKTTDYLNYYTKPYEPGKYYYKETIKDEATGVTKTIYQIEESTDGPREGIQYFTGDVKESGETTFLTKDETTGQLVEVTIPLFTLTNVQSVTLIDILNYIPEGQETKVSFYYPTLCEPTQEEIENQITVINKYNWNLVTKYPIVLGQDDKGNDIYYTDSLYEVTIEGDPITGFFVPGGFYYPVSINGTPLDDPYSASEWRIDNSQVYTSGRKYFSFDAKEITNIYRPGVYHYQVGDDYVLDNAPIMTAGRKYYLGSLYYVINDTKDIFKKYSAWNNAVNIVPSAVTLGRRTTQYTMEELTGFARTLNTIHGLILGVNDLIEFNDLKTRDTQTLQGCINQINDIIVKFDKLIPERFLVVDDYGRVHNADFSTFQDSSYNKVKNNADLLKDVSGDKFAENASENGVRKQWITVNVDGDVDNPSVRIHHNFNPVPNRNFTSDKNTETRTNQHGTQNSITAAKYGNNNNNNDNLVLYNPLVDPMGHVVGIEKETLTLPYGYKYIQTNGRGNDTNPNTGTSTLNTITADSTQDTLFINSGNQWIRTDAVANTDTLTISHDIHEFLDTTTSNSSLSKTTNETVTFTVPTYSFDAAGHYTQHNVHTYTMPFSYGVVTGDKGITTARATLDTIAIVSGDNWLETDASTADTLTINHSDPVSGTVTTKSNATLKFGDSFSIEDWHFDGKGHKFNGTSHTITIPTLQVTPDTSGNVVTNVKLSQDKQSIEEVRENVGTLTLAGFSLGSSAEIIASSDTINSAFGKLQVQVSNEVQNRKTAISQEVTDRNNAISTAINQEVTDRNSAITSAIEKLDKTDTAQAGKYVSAVSETNGVITVSRESLPDYSQTYAPLNGSVNTSSTFEYVGGALTEEEKTIAWLFKKVADLEGQIALLTGGAV